MDKTDLDFLQSYIKSLAIIAPNRAIAITNADSKRFIFASYPFIKLLNQRNLDGKKLSDILQIMPYLNEYRALFKRVISTAKPVSALIAHDFNADMIKSIKLLYKEPIVSPITGKVVAIADEITDFNVTNQLNWFIRLMHFTTGTNINTTMKSGNLTKRQKEILFLLSLGKSSKDIAEFISIMENKILSPLTVNAVINKHLYVKFGVSTTSQLIEKAVILGFINTIPDSFIRKSGVLMVLD